MFPISTWDAPSAKPLSRFVSPVIVTMLLAARRAAMLKQYSASR